jgi:hypothetical protein
MPALKSQMLASVTSGFPKNCQVQSTPSVRWTGGATGMAQPEPSSTFDPT